MVVQGVENMMKVKVIHFQRGPDTSNDKNVIYFCRQTVNLSGLNFTLIVFWRPWAAIFDKIVGFQPFLGQQWEGYVQENKIQGRKCINW